MKAPTQCSGSPLGSLESQCRGEGARTPKPGSPRQDTGIPGAAPTRQGARTSPWPAVLRTNKISNAHGSDELQIHLIHGNKGTDFKESSSNASRLKGTQRPEQGAGLKEGRREGPLLAGRSHVATRLGGRGPGLALIGGVARTDQEQLTDASRSWDCQRLSGWGRHSPSLLWGSTRGSSYNGDPGDASLTVTPQAEL